MDFLTILLVAVGLSMDAVAVALSSGLALGSPTARHACLMGGTFGLFQAAMPAVGYLAGTTLRSWVAQWDHWVAFGLLAAVGGHMLWEARLPRCGEPRFPSAPLLLSLGVATSLDALAVGIGFAFLRGSLLGAVAVIGAVTFVLSSGAVLVGGRLGCRAGRWAEVMGGLLLVGIGLRILVRHLTGVGGA